MPVFNISINYTTGNSLQPLYVEEETIGIVTTDLESAKRNLKKIKDHYTLHKEDPNFDRDYKIKLETDEGFRTIEPFWIGYFENLNSAKIVIEDDPEMSFTT